MAKGLHGHGPVRGCMQSDACEGGSCGGTREACEGYRRDLGVMAGNFMVVVVVVETVVA